MWAPQIHDKTIQFLRSTKYGFRGYGYIKSSQITPIISQLGVISPETSKSTRLCHTKCAKAHLRIISHLKVIYGREGCLQDTLKSKLNELSESADSCCDC